MTQSCTRVKSSESTSVGWLFHIQYLLLTRTFLFLSAKECGGVLECIECTWEHSTKVKLIINHRSEASSENEKETQRSSLAKKKKLKIPAYTQMVCACMCV